MSSLNSVTQEQILKQMKEDFVSNLSGSSLQRISMVMLVGPLSVFLQRVLRSSLGFSPDNTSLGAFLVDFFTIVMPMVVVFLIGDATAHLYFVLLALTFAVGSRDIVPNLNGGYCWKRWNLDELLKHLEEPRKPFLTAFRTMMMVLIEFVSYILDMYLRRHSCCRLSCVSPRVRQDRELRNQLNGHWSGWFCVFFRISIVEGKVG